TDSVSAQRYMEAEISKKRELLAEEVKLTDRADFQIWARPKYIQQLEWFASAQDLAKAIAWFKGEGQTKQVARKILSVNPGLDFDQAKWAYIGFKGGSEPGVVSMTYLLKSTNGNWHVLSAEWNNTEKNIDIPHFASLV